MWLCCQVQAAPQPLLSEPTPAGTRCSKWSSPTVCAFLCTRLLLLRNIYHPKPKILPEGVNNIESLLFKRKHSELLVFSNMQEFYKHSLIEQFPPHLPSNPAGIVALRLLHIPRSAPQWVQRQQEEISEALCQSLNSQIISKVEEKNWLNAIACFLFNPTWTVRNFYCSDGPNFSASSLWLSVPSFLYLKFHYTEIR